eukprot:scaffold43926_cov71-Phaeocystis_antarctica.AAC.6
MVPCAYHVRSLTGCMHEFKIYEGLASVWRLVQGKATKKMGVFRPFHPRCPDLDLGPRGARGK